MINIFYLILFHKNLNQLKLQINSLMEKNTYFFVHVDKKFIDKYFTLFDNNPKVIFINRRINVYLSTWKLIDATVELLQTAYQFSIIHNISNTYYVLMSGQDYKVKSTLTINTFFNKNYPNNFIDVTPFHKDNWIYYKFNTIKFLTFRNDLKRIFGSNLISLIISKTIVLVELILTAFHKVFNKELDNKKIFFGGSAWWALSDSFIKYFFSDVYMSDFYLFLRKKILLTPEEVFFQTIVMNSPFKTNIKVNSFLMREQNCLTYANFKPNIGLKFTGHPYIIEKQQIKELVCDDRFLFARKFDIQFDPLIFDTIEDVILREKK